MPQGDRTGPMGGGPMTGRGAGFCGGHNMPGRDFWAQGGGRGWRHWFYITGLPAWMRFGWRLAASGVPTAPSASRLSQEDEVEALKAQAGYLEQTLQSLRRRIQRLEGEAKTG
jgi:hypothetical protein